MLPSSGSVAKGELVSSSRISPPKSLVVLLVAVAVDSLREDARCVKSEVVEFIRVVMTVGDTLLL